MGGMQTFATACEDLHFKVSTFALPSPSTTAYIVKDFSPGDLST